MSAEVCARKQLPMTAADYYRHAIVRERIRQEKGICPWAPGCHRDLRTDAARIFKDLES